MSILKIIKQAGVGAVEASNPVAVLFATVTQTNPLTVNVDQRFDLPEDFLVRTERMASLQVGDGVVLLRVQGGQEYVILDKLAEVPE